MINPLQTNSRTTRRLLLLAVALLALTANRALAQATLKDAPKAILRLTAYNDKGALVHAGTACYIDANGTVAAAYSLLKGTTRAEVTDAKGKTYALHRILGANATTDLVKFSVSGAKKVTFLSIAETPAQKYAALNLMPYTTDKKAEPARVNVSGVEAYNDYKYYQVSAENDSTTFCCPLLDAEGRLVAFVQPNVEKGATTACAIDARFLNDLSITTTSAFNADLRALAYPKAIPADRSEAVNYLTLTQSADSATYVSAANDFIAAYPDAADGYLYRGQYQARLRHFAAADADFNTALEKARKSADTLSLSEDALHYNLSKLIYNAAINQLDSIPVHPTWTMQRAEQEAYQANTLRPNPLYVLQKAHCQYAQRNYAAAAQNFEAVCANAAFADAPTYFSAARAVELSGGDSLRVIALLDSCVARIPQPISAQNAQYLIERAVHLEQVGQYRRAVQDYNQYEQVIGPKNLNERFYYLRAQAEIQSRMYQQALDDLNSAAATSKTPVAYKVEGAYLLLSVGEYATAIEKAQEILKADADNANCFYIIGIAQGELGQKAQAVQNLNKAKSLGINVSDEVMKRYQ